MTRFPITKDEKFLLGIAEKSLESTNTLFGWVSWKDLAKKLNFGEKSAGNMVQILSKTALVEKNESFLSKAHPSEKSESCIRLTAVAMKHYGAAICSACKIDESYTQMSDEEDEFEAQERDLQE